MNDSIKQKKNGKNPLSSFLSTLGLIIKNPPRSPISFLIGITIITELFLFFGLLSCSGVLCYIFGISLVLFPLFALIYFTIFTNKNPIILYDPSDLSQNKELMGILSKTKTFTNNKIVDTNKLQELENKENPKIAEQFELASMYKGLKKWTKAVEKCSIIISEFGNNAPTLSLRGSCYLFMGDYKNAIKDLEIAIKLDPYDARAKNNLSYTYTEIGKNLDKAEYLIDDALEMIPFVPYFLETKGFVLLKKGEIEKSIRWFDKAIKILSILEMPDDPYLLQHKTQAEVLLKNKA